MCFIMKFTGNTLIHIVIFIVCFFASSIFFRAVLRKQSGENLDRLSQIKRDISTKLSLANPAQLEGFSERLGRDIHTSVHMPRFDDDQDMDADGDPDPDSNSDDNSSENSDTSDDNSIDDFTDAKDNNNAFDTDSDDSDCSTSSDDDPEVRAVKKEECEKEKRRRNSAMQKAIRRKNRVGMAVENFVDKQRGTINDAKKVMNGVVGNIQTKINHAVNQYAT